MENVCLALIATLVPIMTLLMQRRSNERELVANGGADAPPPLGVPSVVDGDIGDHERLTHVERVSLSR